MKKIAQSIFCILAMSIAAHAAAQTRSSPVEFAKNVLPMIQEAIPEATLEQEPGDPLQINISGFQDIEDVSINLHRIHNFCLSSSDEDCQQEIAQLLTVFSQPLPEFGAANLRIFVRDEQYFTNVMGTLPQDAHPPFKRIGEDLYAILVLDSPDAIRLATPEDLEDMGLSPDEAWQLGFKQTETIGAVPEPRDFDGQAFAFQLDEYAGSLLIDLTRWSAISKKVGPDLMIAPVSDQFVFISVIPDGSNFEEIKRIVAQDCAQAARCISPYVYRFRNNMWVKVD